MFEMCFRSFLFWIIVGGKVRFLQPHSVTASHFQLCCQMLSHLWSSMSLSPSPGVQDLPPLSLFCWWTCSCAFWWTNTFCFWVWQIFLQPMAGRPARHQENELRYPPNIFDLVVLRETLMYLDREDKAVILRKIKQLLRCVSYMKCGNWAQLYGDWPVWLARWFIWNGALPLDLVRYQRVRVWQIIGRRLNPPMLFE